MTGHQTMKNITYGGAKKRKKRGRRRSKKFPFQKVYLKRKKCYTVRRKRSKSIRSKKRVFSKCTSEENAKRQMRLLAAVMYNPKFKRQR